LAIFSELRLPDFLFLKLLAGPLAALILSDSLCASLKKVYNIWYVNNEKVKKPSRLSYHYYSTLRFT
jgi:hypothetical protein